MAIKAVVLDIGVVLLRLDFNPLFRRLGVGEHSIKESVELLSVWPPHDAFERGKITREGFLDAVAEKFGHRFTPEEFKPLWNSVIVGEAPGIPAIVESLSKQLPLYALTNATEPHTEHMVETYPWFKYFKKIYTSFDLGCRKPEKEIYEKVAQAIGLAPREMLFVDDRLDNVEGARAVGFHAEQCVDSPRELLAALTKHGVKV